MSASFLREGVIRKRLSRQSPFEPHPGRVPTLSVAVYYAQRAAAGLIITEATEVSQQGTGCPNTPGIYTDEQVAAYAHLIVSTEDDMRHGGRSSTGR